MKRLSEAKADPKKVDRRIMRTRQALRAALMQLIQEKGFDSISVEEITDKANLGRATFYLHYKDKEDLLLEEFRDIARNRVQMLSETPISIWKSKLDSLGLSDGDTLSMPLFMIFEHAAQNADLYRILLKDEGSLQIRAQLGEIAIQAISEIFGINTQNEPSLNEMGVSVELVAAYFNGALEHSLKWWLEQETSLDPINMTRNFQRLFFHGLMNTLEVEKTKSG
jgi:AcrR family transcriptional regulator